MIPGFRPISIAPFVSKIYATGQFPEYYKIHTLQEVILEGGNRIQYRKCFYRPDVGIQTK